MVEKWSVDYPAVNGWEKRNAYVYLPAMYEEEPERRFPVLYMFDGQNVFWDEDATYGKSWGLEKFLDEHRLPIIVAALQCNTGANNERLIEYSPYRFDDKKYGHFEGRAGPPWTGLSTSSSPSSTRTAAPCPTGPTPLLRVAPWAD